MQTNVRDRELLHVKQAAAELDVHESTIRRHIAAGELRAFRLGANGRYRIRRGDLEQFLLQAGPRP